MLFVVRRVLNIVRCALCVVRCALCVVRCALQRIRYVVQCTLAPVDHTLYVAFQSIKGQLAKSITILFCVMWDVRSCRVLCAV